MLECYSKLRRLFGDGETPPTEQYLGGWTQCRSAVTGAVRVRRRITVLAKHSTQQFQVASPETTGQRLDVAS